MAELQVDELEQFLILYAQERFQDKKMKDLRSRLDIMLKRDFSEYLTWIVRAFVRCINSFEESMNLRDIVAIVLAEANLAANSPPFFVFVSNNFLDSFQTFDFLCLIESEIHRWLVYLQENSKLRGVYWRFTGKLIKK